MKSFFVASFAMILLTATHAEAVGYGYGCSPFGFDHNSCDFAASLWRDYCHGGPSLPASYCNSGGCGRGISARPACGASGCADGCGGYGYGGYGYGGYGYGGYGYGGYGTGNWWYGYGQAPCCRKRWGGCAPSCAPACDTGCNVGCGVGCDVGCGAGSCRRSGCGPCGKRYAPAGRGERFCNSLRNRISYASWIGGGPLDCNCLVGGYGFPSGGIDYGFADGFAGCGQSPAGCQQGSDSPASPPQPQPPQPPSDGLMNYESTPESETPAETSRESEFEAPDTESIDTETLPPAPGEDDA